MAKEGGLNLGSGTICIQIITSRSAKLWLFCHPKMERSASVSVVILSLIININININSVCAV